MSEKYTYLFPYEKIPQGSRIIIYGAGDVGQEYLRQMLLTRYCEVLGFVDRAYAQCPVMIVPVYAPDIITSLSFDYVLLAFKMETFAADVKKILLDKGIQENKIIFQGARNEPPPILLPITTSSEVRKKYAFEVAPLSIALKYGPGLGDAIIKKRLFIEITRMAPEAKIDIYAPGGTKFIPSLYSDQPQLHQVIDDGGVLYAEHHKEYGLSMSIFFMILTDHIEYEKIKTVNPAFAEQMKKHVENHIAYKLNISPSTQNWIHFSRVLYRHKNCYTLYDYTGIFNIRDTEVNIPLLPAFQKQWADMRLGRYITLNYGNGSASSGNKQSVSKQWPKEYFDRFVILFRKKYPNINIVQVGDDSTEKIEHATSYVLGQNLELVKYLLKGALFHLDIEGGLMHLATQLQTKCIVIFGATQAELFGYPQNINIVSAACSGCYRLYDNFYECARGMEKPECIWSITPEMVMERVEEYLEGRKTCV